jgi:hypothetical protein
MKVILLYAPIFGLAILAGCSFLSSQPDLGGTSDETPAWIYAPYEVCREESELCATGEAKNYTQSDAQARNNLASIFEVKIQSELSVHTTSTQTFPWQGSVREEVQKSLQESVDQILEAVQIKKHFKSKGLAYSLASLDRAKASELLSARLQKIDDELNTLWSKRSRTNLRRIIRLYLEREKLNERYSIASGSPKPSPMTYKEIIEWKVARAKVIPIALRVGQAPDWMTEKLKELLTEAGFRIVKGNSDKAISLNVESIKEFLNVEGFEKYTFTMTLMSYENGEKNKVLSASETVNGRSQADALLKVKTFFNDYLEQHLADLHLD